MCCQGGSGVVVVFDEQWLREVEKALTRADRISRNHLHDDDAEENATPLAVWCASAL